MFPLSCTEPMWDSPDGSTYGCAADLRSDVTADVNQIFPAAAAASGFPTSKPRLLL